MAKSSISDSSISSYSYINFFNWFSLYFFKAPKVSISSFSFNNYSFYWDCLICTVFCKLLNLSFASIIWFVGWSIFPPIIPYKAKNPLLFFYLSFLIKNTILKFPSSWNGFVSTGFLCIIAPISLICSFIMIIFIFL